MLEVRLKKSVRRNMISNFCHENVDSATVGALKDKKGEQRLLMND